MNYKVKIGDRVFDVEVRDLYARPILARVDGVEIEVWPEENRSAVRSAAPSQPPQSRPALATPPPFPTNGTAAVPTSTPLQIGNPRHILAPIPGVILQLLVSVGDEVAAGQALFILEAMKMKNTIRAGRAARIGKIHVNQGQTVKHHDLILEYEE